MPVVKFYASLRRITGVKEKHIPGYSLRLLLDALERDFPPLGAYLHGNERGRLIITLNGHPLDLAASLDIPLTEADQVAIFPPIAGG
jgi:MoaD family protein